MSDAGHAFSWRQPPGWWPARGACPAALRLGLGAPPADWPDAAWRDQAGHTLWHYWACCPDPMGSWALVREHACAQVRDHLADDGAHPCHWLALQGCADAVALWQETWGRPQPGPWRGDSLLHCATWSGDLTTLQHCLPTTEEGANVLDSQGCPPLVVAVYRGGYEHVRALIEAGADPNLRDAHGRTPLHHAALLGDVDLFGKMEDLGGDVHQADREGDTPESVLDDRLEMSSAQVAALRQHWAKRYQMKLRF